MCALKDHLNYVLIGVIPAAGLNVGIPKHRFFPRRSVKLMLTYEKWEATNLNWALGYSEGTNSKIQIIKDLGIIDSILVIRFDWY